MRHSDHPFPRGPRPDPNIDLGAEFDLFAPRWLPRHVGWGDLFALALIVICLAVMVAGAAIGVWELWEALS